MSNNDNDNVIDFPRVIEPKGDEFDLEEAQREKIALDALARVKGTP